MRLIQLGICSCLLFSCARDARNPFELAPETPFSTYTPMRGNCLISSKYCHTLLPPEFGENQLSLAQLLDIALQNNPTTKKTWAKARYASAEYGSTLSDFYPDIEFIGLYYRQRSGSPTTSSVSGTTNSRSVIESYFTETGPDVTLSYTLFDFGQRTATSLAARESLYYADLTHNQQIQTVLQTVMSDYYDYLYQLAVRSADEADLKNAEMSLDAANEKFSLGLAALGEVAQARTQFLQNKIKLNNQKQKVQNSFAQLAVDLGLPSNISFQVQPLPEQVVANPILEDIETLVKISQKQRQDLLAKQANYRSKKASLLEAKRSIYPIITSQFSTGRYWFQDAVIEKKNHWTAIFKLNFPIFNGYYYRNQIKEAEADVELSQAELLQTELSLIQSVTNAHVEVKTAAINLTDTDEYLKAAELEFEIALSSYKAGTMTILDVIQAQSSLADARSQKASAQKNWFLSLADLAYATGSLCACPTEELQ